MDYIELAEIKQKNKQYAECICEMDRKHRFQIMNTHIFYICLLGFTIVTFVTA